VDRRRTLTAAGLLLIAGAGLARTGAGSGDSFDRLSDSDRQAFQERFEREIWPLLVKGGKDGCVGCHTAKHSSTLRFSGQAADDYRALLKDGFLLEDDPGNLLARLVVKNPKARMPPGNRPPWPTADVEVLRRFIADVQKKQQK
jgi:hypothetical protein